jgi:putative membrane protein
VIRWATLIGLAGLALATALFIRQGISPVLAAFSAAGFGILWASLSHLVPMTLNARAWRILLPRARRGSLSFFLWAVWLREAVNGLLPVARIGGEVASAQLLIRHRLSPPKAVASLVVDMTVSLLSQFVFTLLGLALLVSHESSGGLVRDVALGLIVTIPVAAAFLAAQRFGVFTVLARLFRSIFGDRFDALVGGAAALDRAVRRLYRRRRAVFFCFLWQLAAWTAGAGEIWLSLRFLGHPSSFADAFIIEALIQALSSSAFIVPGALGVQEGGFLAIGGVLGLAPDVALALALMRRARDIVIFLPALLAWQAAAARRAVARFTTEAPRRREKDSPQSR